VIKFGKKDSWCSAMVQGHKFKVQRSKVQNLILLPAPVY